MKPLMGPLLCSRNTLHKSESESPAPETTFLMQVQESFSNYYHFWLANNLFESFLHFKDFQALIFLLFL